MQLKSASKSRRVAIGRDATNTLTKLLTYRARSSKVAGGMQDLCLELPQVVEARNCIRVGDPQLPHVCCPVGMQQRAEHRFERLAATAIRGRGAIGLVPRGGLQQ